MDTLKLDDLVGSLQAFEMTLISLGASKSDDTTECPLRKQRKKTLQVT